VKGFEQLKELHRSWIDNVVIKCPKCGRETKRVEETGDCWLDAGVVYFSTLNYLDNKKYWPIFKTAEKLDVPVFIHPREPSPDMIKPYMAYPWLFGAVWGYGAEVGLHAMRLICSGLFDEFPKLKIILGHMGEGIPFWLWRIDNQWKMTGINIKKRPSEYFKENFFLSTSGMCSNPALMCAYMELGADNIMFAVDYPIESTEEAVSFMDSASICASDKEKIYHLNAEKLFKL